MPHPVSRALTAIANSESCLVWPSIVKAAGAFTGKAILPYPTWFDQIAILPHKVFDGQLKQWHSISLYGEMT